MSKRTTLLLKTAVAAVLGIAVVDKSMMAWHSGSVGQGLMAALYLFVLVATLSDAIDAARRS